MSRFDPSRVDVEHFLDTLGIENITRATQQEMRFSCPFPNHDGGDETPSAYMNLDSGKFFCHACKERGTVIDFAAYVLQISPLESIALLKQAYMPGAINPDARDMLAEVKKIMYSEGPRILQPQLDESVRERFAMDWAEAWMAWQTLGWESFQPCDYFFERGFEPETMMDWQFGWCDRTQRIVFPIRDVAGTLIGFKGRATDGRKPKYLVLGDSPDKNSWGFKRYYPSHVVFGAHLYREKISGPLVICEGELNAIATIQKTEIPAVAINGSFFSAFHAKIIRKIAGDEGVILFLDEDQAGQNCIWGWENSRGEWHPGIVELLSPHMPVKLVPSHELDAADMSVEEISECLDGARDQFLIRIEELVRSR
jgi:hypothetical protein